MKKFLLSCALVVCAGVVACSAFPSGAAAAVPCRNKIYNDWYHDGKIASTYPLACYRDALTHVRGDLKVYSSLTDDIRSALQAAIARKNGKQNVPDQVGKGTTPTRTIPVLVDTNNQTTKTKTTSVATTTTSSNDTVSQGPTVPPADSGGGIPLPLIVLGALAILLAGAGAVGMIVKRRRGDATI
ncbi:MAG: hypothetical protein H0X39_04010 [Actinobacteria bacterium]|nr:hypothetical protein [Actinomycetota bacterium]